MNGDDSKALHVDHLVMRESPANIWRHDDEVMTEREVAIWHSAFIAGQNDMLHRIMNVIPRNSVYRPQRNA